IFYNKMISIKNHGLLGGFILVILPIFFAIILKLFALRIKKTYKDIKIKQILKDHPPLYFSLGIIAFNSIAIMLDLHILNFAGNKFLEELFEMNGALSLLFACFSVGEISKTRKECVNSN
ncbi:MAG: hypothetical protein QNJ46_24750, partial [Leptolyngbyaceae cyanobacterium MO_188.B28]|nr:hypothetical protein [Leptolyngbyaceae cyanobacterium MO_188.B28]